jgi:uncharacterized RDD family membrane protein YckC
MSTQTAPFAPGLELAMTSSGEPQGVWYRSDDYAGFARRLAIIVFDFLVVFIASVPFISLALLQFLPGVQFVGWLCFCLLYLFLAAHSVTLGFLILNARIVTIYGNRPTFRKVLFRFLLWLLPGPFNPVVDLLWMTGDDRKQTICDKMAGTYIVSRDAVPAGSGKVKLGWLLFMAVNLPHLEVEEPRRG